MGELLEFSQKEASDLDHLDSGILSGEEYKEQRALLQQFIDGKISYIPNLASEAQAQGMAEKAGIDLPSTASDLYGYMRGLTTPFSDAQIFDEVLRLTKNQKRGDFRKFYSDLFPDTSNEQRDEITKAA